MNNHSFCQQMLKEARKEAAAAGVTPPAGMTALKSFDGKQYFIEAKGMNGQYVKGCCAYEAKANFIGKLVDQNKPQRTI